MAPEILSNFFRVGELRVAGHFMVADVLPINNEYLFGCENKIIALSKHNDKHILAYKNNEMSKFLLYCGISDDELLEYVISEQNKEWCSNIYL